MKIAHTIEREGIITARCYDQTTLTVFQRLWNRFVLWLGLDRKKYFILGKLRWEDEQKNVICNAGIAAVNEILAGIYGATGEVNYMALGSNAGAVSASDVALGTEVYRNASASGTVSGNILYLTAFFNETETSGTYEEFGNFIDATGAADSGEMWTHVLTGGWVKSLTDVLVVDCKYTTVSV